MLFEYNIACFSCQDRAMSWLVYKGLHTRPADRTALEVGIP